MLVFCNSVSRDDLFEELLQEPDEVSKKRKHTLNTLRVLEQAERVSALCI